MIRSEWWTRKALLTDRMVENHAAHYCSFWLVFEIHRGSNTVLVEVAAPKDDPATGAAYADDQQTTRHRAEASRPDCPSNGPYRVTVRESTSRTSCECPAREPILCGDGESWGCGYRPKGRLHSPFVE